MGGCLLCQVLVIGTAPRAGAGPVAPSLSLRQRQERRPCSFPVRSFCVHLDSAASAGVKVKVKVISERRVWCLEILDSGTRRKRHGPS